jgi:hypothetical protein
LASVNGSGNGHDPVEPSAPPAGDPHLRAIATDLRWSLLVLNGAPLDADVPCYVAGAASWLNSVAPVLERDLAVQVHRLDRVALRTVTDEGRAALPACAAPLGVALREVAPGTTLGVNFRRDEFAYHRGQQEVRRALGRVALLAGVLVLLGIANLFAAYQLELSRLAALDEQIRKVFLATLPDERPVNERVQLQGEIEKAEQKVQLLGQIVSLSGVAAIDIARAISSALPAATKTDIDEYIEDPEAIRIRGRTESFEMVDTIKQHLTSVPIFNEVQVKDVKQSPDGKDVSFRLILVMTKTSQTGE